MILKALKEKSNKKFVQNLLDKRKVDVHHEKVKSVGVLLHKGEFDNADVLINLFKDLQNPLPSFKVAFFEEEETGVNTKWDTNFTKKDFGWRGKILNQELKDFVDTNFDLLISYYKSDSFELQQITAMSKTNLKIGVKRTDASFFDLIIDVSLKDHHIFKQELKKYLTMLNKL